MCAKTNVSPPGSREAIWRQAAPASPAAPSNPSINQSNQFNQFNQSNRQAMREVLGAGRGVQVGGVETPAMAAEARKETTRQGAEGDEEGDGGDGAQDSERVRLRLCVCVGLRNTY